MASRPFKDLDAALDWLFSSTNYEQKKTFRYNVRAFNLDRTRSVLARLGDPHLAYPTVHVAGTKGKGSTSAMTASLLSSVGLRKVGLYTSPHLMNLEERIRVNSSDVSPRDLYETLCLLKRPVEDVTSSAPHMKPTFFEIFTVAAFAHFARKKVDAAVIEVGLGGRLDATNVVRPLVTGITPVSFDHTAVLGETLDAIAREKAGIIKPSTPLVVGRQEHESFAAIDEIARRVGAPVIAYGRDLLLYEGPSRAFTVVTPCRTYADLTLTLLGPHQRRNAAMAVQLTEIAARKLRLPFTPAAARRALASFGWPGRVELLSDTPPVVIDAAHNAASAKALADALAETFPRTRCTVLIGIAAHKDTAGVVDALLPIASRFVATTIDSPRSETAGRLARRIRSKTTLPIRIQPDRVKALALARKLAAGSPLVVTGSFYLAGELRTLLLDNH